MDEIKKNLLSLWDGLSAQKRVSLIASFILSLALLSGIVYLASKPKLTLLFGGLSPSEASKVVEYLQSKNIAFEVNDGGRAVMVPAQQVYTIRLGLASQGIPSMSEATGLGFELFDRPTFGMSDFMQRANYYRALQGELARTIRQIEDIQNARVLIVVPEDRLFGQNQQPARASVFVQLNPGHSLAPEQVRAIRFLVSSGVENLQPERVSIVDDRGHALAESDDGVTGDDQNDDKRHKARAELEEYLQEKAQSMLDQVLGPGQAVVRISTEIDYDKLQTTTEKYDPKNEAIRREVITTEDNSSKTANTASGAGTSANSSSGSDSGDKQSDQKRQNTTNEYEVGRDVESREVAEGSIKRLSIALLINQRKPLTAGAHPIPREPAELTGLENLVKAAVGFVQSDSRQDYIQTQEIAFADLFADSAPIAAKSSMEDLDKYLPYATQLCLILLAAGILLYFRSIISGAPKGAEIKADSFENLLRNYHNIEQSVSQGDEKPAAEPSGILTPEELARLIRENPANTSQAVKAWLRRN